MASINNAFQKIEAFDLFRKREQSLALVTKEIGENLRQLGFTLIQFNLMNVDIPSKFNGAVKKTQIIK